MFKTFPVSSAGAVTSELVSAFEVSGVVALCSLYFRSQQTLLLPLLRTAVHLRLSFSYKTLLNIC
jgi:hypothetical protein